MSNEVVPAIYVDFHKSIASPWTPGHWAVPVVCSGTLDDLSQLGLRLREGLRAVVFFEDVEYDGVARFDLQSRRWYFEHDDSTLRYVTPHDYGPSIFLCWSCRRATTYSRLDCGERCPYCNADLGALWAPP